MEKINIKTRPDLGRTLKELTIGVEYIIEQHQFKPLAIRQRVAELRSKGYEFKVSETGMVTGCKVTRLK